MLVRHDKLTKQQYIDYMTKYYNKIQEYAYKQKDENLLEILSPMNIIYGYNTNMILYGNYKITLGTIYKSGPLKLFLMSTIKQLEYTDLFRSSNKQRCNTQQIIQLSRQGSLESMFNNIQKFDTSINTIELWLPEHGEKCRFTQSRLEPRLGYLKGVHGSIAPFSHYLLDDEFKTPVYYVPTNQSNSNIFFNLIEPYNLKAQSVNFQSFDEESEIPF